MYLGRISLPASMLRPTVNRFAPAPMQPLLKAASRISAPPAGSNSRAESDRVAAVLAAQGAALRATQPHGLGPSSKWNSYSGEPLPAGTFLSPKLQARLNAGQGVTARWSPQQQLWISAI